MAFLLAVSAVMSPLAASGAGGEYSLLVARVASAKHLGDESYLDEESGHPAFVHRFSVTLRNVRVVEGSHTPRGPLKLDLSVGGLRRNPTRFPELPEIYVVVRLDADGHTVAEDWGPVVRIVCLHDNELERFGLGEQFDSDYEQMSAGGAACAMLE